MKNGSFRFAAGAGAVAAVLLSTTAALADATPVRIWVSAQPWTCAREIGPFARHVELACDALGGACQVAPSEKDAAYRATLSCGDAEGWSLDLQKIDGAEVLTLALDGDREQRLRKAAMWTAHASVGEPPPRRAGRAAPPEPPPAAAESESEPEPPPPPPPPREFIPPPPADAPDAVQPDARRETRGGITLSGLGAATNAGRGGDLLVGGRASMGFGLGRGVFIGPTFTYARSADRDGSGGLYLGGAAIGVGAPFGGRWVGASLEGGAGPSVWGTSFDEREPSRQGEMNLHVTAGRTKVAGYARAAFILQAPIDFAVRPMLSISAMHVTSLEGSSAQVAMLDLGVAWPGW